MKPLAVVVAMAALFAMPQVAAAQTSGTAPFCMNGLYGTRCVFSTMGECESARTNPSKAQCITRTDALGTTGLGERPEWSGTKLPPQLPPIRTPDE
jgi:hypothetical protein